MPIRVVRLSVGSWLTNRQMLAGFGDATQFPGMKGQAVKIDIAGPMVGAHRGDTDTYTPVVDGRSLALECHSVESTLANLRHLTDTSSKKLQRQVLAIYAFEGRILIVFDTGEAYLATGFSLGTTERETTELALFAAKHGLGEKRDCMALCRTLPVHHTGPVLPQPKPPQNAADMDSGVISTGDTQTLSVFP